MPMKSLLRLALLWIAVFCVVSVQARSMHAQAHAAQRSVVSAEATAIFAMMNKSADDWNRGDIDAFAKSYKNSPDILFMGRTISHGYAQMLAHYKERYPTPDAMGALSFTQLEVQGLDPRFATVTGQFHLVRAEEEGGNQNGYFLLVVEKTSLGWKIVRDDTTPLPPLD
jgi:ketosteroid isomerase-like protein